jgi:multicomponent Na+:H+ antiporter subunit D
LLWFSGALGLAGAPPFLLMIGEAGLSKAAEEVSKTWISWAFMAGGALTSAAVLRVGMHTFWGWGSEPITDEAAEIGELPETAEEDQRIFWYQFVPAAICFAMPIALAAMPGWLHVLREASTVFSEQSAMAQLIYNGGVSSGQFAGWSETFMGSAIRSAGVFLIAILLALSSVCRRRLKRPMRIGPFLESGFHPLRRLQSGHPADYVLWISIGLATVGLATLLLARS